VSHGPGTARSVKGGGDEPTQTAGPDGAEPDEVIHPAGELMSDLELERDLATPATQYAIVEDALAQAMASIALRCGAAWRAVVRLRSRGSR
jgi:acetyl-CoA C-acetyltransferase